MSKFDDVKPKNIVYHLFCGKGIVTSVSLGGGKVVFFTVKFKNCEATFDVDGYLLDKNCEREEKIVTLYWNEVKLPTEEEDTKPFDLIEFLIVNFNKVNFTPWDSNVFLYYDYNVKRLVMQEDSTCENVGTVYLKFNYIATQKKIIDVMEKINNNKVTPQQLKEAYKELGWL